MTTNLTLNITLPVEQNITDELFHIRQEYYTSNVLKEISLFRIRRIHQTKSWKQIVNDSGEQIYSSFEAFITEIVDELSIARQIIFDRIKIYDQLNYLGYDDQSILLKLAERPSFYKRLLDMAIDWNPYENEPNSILIPGSENLTEDSAKTQLREVIENAETFDTQKDALIHFETEILHKPNISAKLDNQLIVVNYTSYSIDTEGNFEIDKYGMIEFYPNSDVPEEVLSYLRKILK